jgi:hypothetical protein
MLDPVGMPTDRVFTYFFSLDRTTQSDPLGQRLGAGLRTPVALLARHRRCFIGTTPNFARMSSSSA